MRKAVANTFLFVPASRHMTAGCLAFSLKRRGSLTAPALLLLVSLSLKITHSERSEWLSPPAGGQGGENLQGNPGW